MVMAEATNEFCFVYSTYPNLETARAAARLAVDQKLAACVNIYPKMTSIYMWQGKLEESAEHAVFFKTRRALVEKLISTLWAEHTYELPSFVVLPLEGGSSDYLAWVREQTEQPTTV
ncbi:MAG: divalent-cation tolerance protein CutA [Alphaproteobacteria bacterium]|nr:divalent-cation tolerance protein CutA [Alphaproteobacteria bacterium]